MIIYCQVLGTINNCMCSAFKYPAGQVGVFTSASQEHMRHACILLGYNSTFRKHHCVSLKYR